MGVFADHIKALYADDEINAIRAWNADGGIHRMTFDTYYDTVWQEKKAQEDNKRGI